MVSKLWGSLSRGQVLEDIQAEARTLDPVRVLLTLIAVPFFLAGWIVSKVAVAVWVALAWIWTAVLVGWRTARGQDGQR